MKLLIPFSIIFINLSILGCKNTDSKQLGKFSPQTALEYYNQLPQLPYFDNEVSEVTSAQRAKGITKNNPEKGYIIGGSETGPKFTLRVLKGDEKDVILVSRYNSPGSMFGSFFKQLEYHNGKFEEKESRLTKFYKDQESLLSDASAISVSLIEDQIVFLEMDTTEGDDHHVHAVIAKFMWNGKEFVETQNRM